MSIAVPTATRPFSERQWQALQPALRQLDPHQCLWLSGYLAGRVAPTGAPEPATATDEARLLIAYGTETGNSKALAQSCAAKAAALGLQAEVADLATLKPRQLAKQRRLVLICSTHGDGEPPEPIHAFHTALMDARAPRLAELEYAVLALGDSSYAQFCATGRQFDERLSELGARRLLPRCECDVDFAAPAAAWIDQALAAVPRPTATAASVMLLDEPLQAQAAATPRHDKQHPLEVEVLDNVRLSAPDRGQPIHHLELALDVPLALVPGDAVGVLVDNPPELVDAVLAAAGLRADAPVTLDGATLPLAQALRERRDLTIPGARLLDAWAGLANDTGLAAIVADAPRKKDFLRQHQVRDLLARHPARVDAQTFVDLLRPLPPRLYDVANDPDDGSGELHLTVQLYRYAFGEREETGIASQALIALKPGDRVRLYPHRHARFHLPANPDASLILVADGTGIAPYRAFMQALARSGQRRRCWLVFAEQRFEDDFLYQLDWQRAHDQGTLTRIDTVFYAEPSFRCLSDPLCDEAAPLLEWLGDGAHVYLCGDQQRLGACDEALQAWYDARSGDGPTWAQLGKDKRIHRNLY